MHYMEVLIKGKKTEIKANLLNALYYQTFQSIQMIFFYIVATSRSRDHDHQMC
jgi:hypothetical protein